LAVILSCIGLAPEARAGEQWQYAETRRVDIDGLAFAHIRPILYFSFSYRGTDGTFLTPATVVGIDLESGKAIADVLPCGTHATNPVVSPDDVYLAFRFHDGAHLIGVRRLTDGTMSAVPDVSPGIKYPQFFSPDSKSLSYRLGEDPEDRAYSRDREDLLVEYSLDSGERSTWSLGVGAAWDLQRLTDDRIMFRAIEPTDGEILRRFARSERDIEYLDTTSLIYTFDKSTGTLRLDPVNELSTYFRNISPYRHFRFVQVIKGQKFYLMYNGYRSADLSVADQDQLTQVARLGGEVRAFRISDDERWLAYVYWDASSDRPFWQYSGRDQDLGIRNMITGETRRVDLREPPFSDIANRQRLGCAGKAVAWLGTPPFDDVAPVPPLVDSSLVRQIIFVLIGLATLGVWVGAGIVSTSVRSAIGRSVTGTLLLGVILYVVLEDSLDEANPTVGVLDEALALATTLGALLVLLPAAAIVAAIAFKASNDGRLHRAPEDKT
jgi:hypothetical protein